MVEEERRLATGLAPRASPSPSRRGDICLRHGLPPPTHYSRNWDMSRGRIYVPRYLEINAIYYKGIRL